MSTRYSAVTSHNGAIDSGWQRSASASAARTRTHRHAHPTKRLRPKPQVGAWHPRGAAPRHAKRGRACSLVPCPSSTFRCFPRRCLYHHRPAASRASRLPRHLPQLCALCVTRPPQQQVPTLNRAPRLRHRQCLETSRVRAMRVRICWSNQAKSQKTGSNKGGGVGAGAK